MSTNKICLCGPDCEATTSGICSRCGFVYERPASPPSAKPREFFVLKSQVCDKPDCFHCLVARSAPESSYHFVEKYVYDNAQKNVDELLSRAFEQTDKICKQIGEIGRIKRELTSAKEKIEQQYIQNCRLADELVQLQKGK